MLIELLNKICSAQSSIKLVSSVEWSKILSRLRCNYLYAYPRYLLMANKANLRDLIAATSIVILLKWDSNCRFFSLCDLEIWWMTSKNNRAPLLYYIKLCASFQIHRWIQTGVTVRKRSIRVKIGNFFSSVTLKFDGWPWKTIRHLLYAMLSFVHHFKAICEFKIELQSGNTQFRSKSAIFVPCDLEIWWRTLKNNRAPLLYYFKLCASFHSHQWIQAGVTVRKPPIWVKINVFFVPCDLEIWQMTLKNNRAPLLSNIKLCASFHHHMWIQTGVTVRKWLSWVLNSVTLTFDLDLLHGHHFCHW